MLGVASRILQFESPSVAERGYVVRELRTPRLPMTHVPVGDCGQYRRSCHSTRVHDSNSDSIVSHPNVKVELPPPSTTMNSESQTIGRRSALQLLVRPLVYSFLLTRLYVTMDQTDSRLAIVHEVRAGPLPISCYCRYSRHRPPAFANCPPESLARLPRYQSSSAGISGGFDLVSRSRLDITPFKRPERRHSEGTTLALSPKLPRARPPELDGPKPIRPTIAGLAARASKDRGRDRECQTKDQVSRSTRVRPKRNLRSRLISKSHVLAVQTATVHRVG